ncbi:LacI family DNA-binding transcriptional regulator [Pedobacter superstes]
MSIGDIAKHLNVSKATVSFVLNVKPMISISTRFPD